MAGKKDDKPKQGKVLPPEPHDVSKTSILAVFAEFHERPDLLLDAVEKRRPGTTKRMTEHAERKRNARFWFSQIQAYTGLVVKVLCALFCFYLLYLAVTGGGFAFFSIIAVTIFYGISQSGNSGFTEITKALAQWITKGIKGNNRDD